MNLKHRGKMIRQENKSSLRQESMDSHYIYLQQLDFNWIVAHPNRYEVFYTHFSDQNMYDVEFPDEAREGKAPLTEFDFEWVWDIDPKKFPKSDEFGDTYIHFESAYDVMLADFGPRHYTTINSAIPHYSTFDLLFLKEATYTQPVFFTDYKFADNFESVQSARLVSPEDLPKPEVSVSDLLFFHLKKIFPDERLWDFFSNTTDTTELIGEIQLKSSLLSKREPEVSQPFFSLDQVQPFHVDFANWFGNVISYSDLYIINHWFPPYTYAITPVPPVQWVPMSVCFDIIKFGAILFLLIVFTRLFFFGFMDTL